MTPITKPVVRRTEYKVRDQFTTVTLAPGGLTMRRLHTKEKFVVDWPTLWRWLETANIPPIR